MPTEKSIQEARRVALTRITNPDVCYVEMEIMPKSVIVKATTYKGEEQTFQWED